MTAARFGTDGGHACCGGPHPQPQEGALGGRGRPTAGGRMLGTARVRPASGALLRPPGDQRGGHRQAHPKQASRAGQAADADSVAVAAWYTELDSLSAPRCPHSLHMYRPPAPGDPHGITPARRRLPSTGTSVLPLPTPAGWRRCPPRRPRRLVRLDRQGEIGRAEHEEVLPVDGAGRTRFSDHAGQGAGPAGLTSRPRVDVVPGTVAMRRGDLPVPGSTTPPIYAGR